MILFVSKEYVGISDAFVDVFSKSPFIDTAIMMMIDSLLLFRSSVPYLFVFVRALK